jgi:hypothetical protein
MAQTTVAINLEAKTKGTESVKSLKTQIREATAEAVQLARKFGEFSPEATAAAQKVAKLKDEMGDFQQRVAGLNPDKFQAIAGVTQGIAGGISAATGAMALFGAESEDAQKTLAKVQGAIAFSQGIQQLLDMRNSFGAMATTIKTQVITAFTTLRGAMMATGIGLLVAGVAALIANFEKVSAWIKNSPFGALANGIGDVINAITDWIGITSEAQRQTDKMLKDTEKSIKQTETFLEANGDKYDAYTNRKIKANLDYKKKVLEVNKDETLSEAQKQAILKQFRDKADREIKKADSERAAESTKAKKDELKKSEELAQKQRELAEQRKQNQLEINATMLALDQSTLDAQIKAADAAFATKVTQLKNQGYTEKQIATLRDAELEKVRTAFYDKQKADQEKANKEREDNFKQTTEKEIADAQKATDDYFTIQQTALIQQGATQAEFDALELKRLNAKLQNARDYGQSTVDIEKDIAAKKKDIYDKDAKAKEDTEKAKRAAEMATLESASSIIGSLGQLFGESEKSQKAFGLAQIAVDTAKALTAAQVNAMATTPDNVATGGAAGFAKYAAYVAIILSNVARAKALIKGSGGGGGGGGSAAAPAAPSFAPTVGGGLPDEQQFGGMGRVYVLEGDITKTQTRVRRLRNTSVV